MNTLKLGSKGADVQLLQKKLNLYADGIFGKITEEAVKDFQRMHSLNADGIVGQKTWAALNNHHEATCTNCGSVALGMQLKRTTRSVIRLIVHCSATPEGKDFTVADITRWHKQQGWSTIGYHYVIYRDGTIHEGRDINLIGAHTEGYNTGSIGICYIGGCATDGKAKDTRTEAQKQSLRTLLSQLRHLYPKAQIYGHRDFTTAKACPSFDAKNEYKTL